MSCAYGVQNVGFVLMAYGACDAICSFSFGFLIKHVGRAPIFIGGTVFNAIVIVVLFAWSPNPDEAYLFYLLAAMWGIADAVWQTQINGEQAALNTHAPIDLVPERNYTYTTRIQDKKET